MGYDALGTKYFKKKLKKMDKNVEKAIHKTVNNKLKINPYSGKGNNGHLQGEYLGLRRIRVLRKWRLVFSICEECRKLGYTGLRGCVDCNQNPDKTVVLFDIWKK